MERRQLPLPQPHVVKINERIKLCAKEISDERFASAAVKVRHAIETGITEGKNSPSFFEAVFLMAMVIFQEEQPDICMIETGMGGRYDATNVICPKVSVITSISEDHMDFWDKTGRDRNTQSRDLSQDSSCDNRTGTQGKRNPF